MDGMPLPPAMNDSADSDETIFAAALQWETPAQRAAYLDEVCAGNAELRRRVEGLLQASGEAQTFLERPVGVPRPAPASAAATVKIGFTDLLSAAEGPGTKIGHYKLLQQIGEGGCGTVFMAEQEEPVRRRVALKVIKLGMDTKSVVARFEAERQALAMMDHPNIAKVLDAGATDAGRPFFVMELVRGIPITRYCDENKLDTQARLDLFIKVCQAIQHAHQKGIIHRDIKPSNILVTLHDGVPVPKVIDFGIAKATEGRLTNATLFTAFEQFIGTPAYMSPEQAEMSGLDIDTRSDIYALGVLLYELLTGKTPFDAKELAQSGIDAMRKTIREKEPQRPSTRLSTMQGDALTATATSHGSDAVKLLKLIRGDLDWIVMKCLEKDRTRRYETANGLAADLKRHLDNEPVIARPPSAVYKFQKAFRRNKLVYSAAACVLVSLIAALVFIWTAAQRESRARVHESIQRNLAEQRRIDAEAARGRAEVQRQAAVAAEASAKLRLAEAEAISKVMTEVFQSPDPARDGRAITAAEMLGAAAKKLETDLADQPARRTQLQSALSMTYVSLGLYPEAIALHEKVRDYYLANFGPEHTNTISAKAKLLDSYKGAGRYNEMLVLAEENRRISGQALGPKHELSIRAMEALAIAYEVNGRQSEAMKLLEETFQLSSSVFGLHHTNTLEISSSLASIYYQANRIADALPLWEEYLRQMRALFGARRPETLAAMNNVALVYKNTGRLPEGLRLLEEVVTIEQSQLGPEHPDTLSSMGNLGDFYNDAGRFAESLKLTEEVVRLRRKTQGAEHPQTLKAIEDLAISLESMGRLDEMKRLMQERVQTIRRTSATNPPVLAEGLAKTASALDRLGQYDEAIPLEQEAIRVSPNTLTHTYWRLARTLMLREHYAEALPVLRQSQEKYANDPGRLNQLAQWNRLAESAAGPDGLKSAATQRMLQESVDGARRNAADRPDDSGPLRRLALLHLWQGETSAHLALCRRLLDLAANSRDETVNERAASTYLVQTGSDPALLESAVSAARRAADLSHEEKHWAYLAECFAAYRTGRFGDAVKFANQTLGIAADNNVLRGQALAWRAMARWRLGQYDSARADLAAVELRLPRSRYRTPLVPAVLEDNEMAMCIVYEEARALIAGPGSQPKTSQP